MIKKKHSFAKSKHFMLLGTLMFLFVLPSLFQAEGFWNYPQEITLTGAAGHDTHIVVDIDDNGVVHYSSTLFFEGYESDTEIFYSNNSAPVMFDSFLTGTAEEGSGNRIYLTNRGDDDYELGDGVSTSISVGGPDNVPLVGFHSNISGTNEIEAFASSINPKTGIPQILQLSTYESHYQDNSGDSDYQKFEYVDRLGSDFIVSRSSDTPLYATFKNTNPAESFEMEELEFINGPNIVSVSNERKYIAAGKTLIIYNSTGDLVGYEGFTSPISTLITNSTNNWMFLTSGRTLYWYNTTKNMPNLINSIQLDLDEGLEVYDVDTLDNYLYFAAGAKGVLAVRYNNNTLTLNNVAKRAELNTYFRAIAVGNKTLYFGDDIGIFSASLNNPETIGIIGQYFRNDVQHLSLDYITYDNSSYLFSGQIDNKILGYNISDHSLLSYIDVLGTDPVYDIIIDKNTDYGYAAVGTDGIQIFNYKTFTSIDLWNGSITNANFIGVSLNGSSLFVCNDARTSSENIVEIDISVPASATKIGSNSTLYGGGPLYIDSNQEKLYLNDQNFGLIVLDISDVSKSRVEGIKTLGDSYDSKLFVHENYVYILDSTENNGLIVIDSNNITEQSVSKVHFGGTNILNDIFVWNNGTEVWGYISNINSSGDLIYFNLTANPMVPSDINTISGFTGPFEIAFDSNNDYLFIADGSSGIRKIDISSIEGLSLPTPDATTIDALYLDWNDGHVYISNSATGVEYYDYTDLDNRIVGTSSIISSSNINSIIGFSASIIFLTESNGIGTFDCADYNSIGITDLNLNVDLSHFSNGTAVAVWESEGGILLRYIYPDLQKSRIYQMGTDSNDNNPKIIIEDKYNFPIIHYFVTNGGNIYYQQSKGTGSFTAPFQLTTEADASNLRIDCERDTIGIVWQKNNVDIQAMISTDFGDSWGNIVEITNDAGTEEINPDIYVKSGGYAEVFFQREMAQNYTIFSASNFDGGFTNHEIMGNYIQGSRFQTSPSVAQKDGLVVVMFENYKFIGSTWYTPEVAVFAYQNIFYGNERGSSYDIDIETNGDYAYIADGDAGFVIVNTSDPIQPIEIGRLETAGSARGVAVVGNLALIADGENGIISVDITNPAIPSELDNLQTYGFSQKIQIIGDYAYIADGDAGLSIIDITTPSSLSMAGNVSTNGYVTGFYINNSIAYIIDQSYGLVYANISTVTSGISSNDIYALSGTFNDVIIKNEIAYVSQNTDLLAIDVRIPIAPALNSTTNNNGVISRFEIVGDTLYVSSLTEGLNIYEIGDEIELLGNYKSPNSVENIKVINGLAFVSDAKSGLLILDISDKELINIIGFNNLGRNYIHLTLDDDPAGEYLFEGIRMNYNTSSIIGSFDQTFLIRDRVTGNEWNHTLNFSADGSDSGINKFFKFNDYFITSGYFDFYVYNGSDMSDMVLRIPCLSLEYMSTQNNISHVFDQYGNYLNYDFFFMPHFEYGNSIIPDSNGLENINRPRITRMDETNFVDVWYINLEEDREYNFYINDDNSSLQVNVQLYHESVQMISQNEPLLEFNSTLTSEPNPVPNNILINQTGRYFVIIQATEDSYNDFIAYGASNCYLRYRFVYAAAPKSPTLLTPQEEVYVSDDDLPIQMEWRRDRTDTDIFKYEIEIYNSSNFIEDNLIVKTSNLGLNNLSYSFIPNEDIRVYWRVRGIDNYGGVGNYRNNNGSWSEVGLFFFDMTDPLAPDINPINIYYETTFFTMTWNASDDGIYDVDRYEIYLHDRPIFVEGLPTENLQKYRIGTVRNALSYTFTSLRNYYRYYIAIEAVDNVGKRSNLSMVVDTSISIGGYIPAQDQRFVASVGDTLVYEVTYVESNKLNVFSEPLMRFYYNDFPQGTHFHFWIKQVDRNEVFPIISEFYATNIHSDSENNWNQIDTRIPISVFSMSEDIHYQGNVTQLYLRNEVPYENFNNQEVYDTLWRFGDLVVDVNVFSYWTDNRNSTASFFVDKETGVLCEVTIYSGVLRGGSNRYGYSLRLVSDGTSIVLNQSRWQNAYIYLILGIVGFATVLDKVIKKVEF